DVTLSSRQQVRGKASFTCLNPELVPTSRAGVLDDSTPLHPFGSYVHIARGIQFSRFGSVLVSLGVYRLDKVKRNRIAGTVTCSGSDFAGFLDDAKFGAPLTRQDWDTVPPTPFLITDTAKLII